MWRVQYLINIAHRARLPRPSKQDTVGQEVFIRSDLQAIGIALDLTIFFIFAFELYPPPLSEVLDVGTVSFLDDTGQPLTSCGDSVIAEGKVALETTNLEDRWSIRVPILHD